MHLIGGGGTRLLKENNSKDCRLSIKLPGLKFLQFLLDQQAELAGTHPAAIRLFVH